MLCVYSSSPTEAQRLLFGHSQAGDLAPLFAGFLDTHNGSKREAASYRVIAAGLRRCQLVRPADSTTASARHPVADDLPAMTRLFGLPASA